MLILWRKRRERLIIGEGENTIIIDVINIRGDKVRLGIEAPRDIRVLRQEVLTAAESRLQAAREGKPCD
jgi:carbon storage regulator